MPDNDEELLKRQQEQQEQQPQQRTPLPDKPEQGDTSALSPLHKGSGGIDMSKRPKTKAPSGARRMGMQMTAEARQFGDEFGKSLQEDKENIRNLFTDPERQVERQARREERKAAKRQTETTADTTEGTSQGQTAQSVGNTGNAQEGEGEAPELDGGTLNAATFTAERGNAERPTENPTRGQTAQGGVQYTKEGPLQEEETPDTTAPKGTYERTFGEPNPTTTTTSAGGDTTPTEVSPTPSETEETAVTEREETAEDGAPVENTEGNPEGTDEEEEAEEAAEEEGTETASGVTQTGAGAPTEGTAAGGGVQNPAGETADPRVAATEQANKASLDAMDRYIDWTNGVLEERRKRDEEQERRDRQDAFWRGIGEVGASLVNLLGVSGAFGGKNAYGRGAYSAMQNFNLTTEKMTDKIRAQREKNRERMDALQDRLGEIKLKRGQIEAQGIAALGEAKGKEKDTADRRADAAAERQFKADEAQKDREAKAAEAKAQREFQAGENAKGRASNEKIAKEKTPKETQTKEEEHDVFTYETKDGGKKHLVATRKSFNHAFENTSGQLADAIARELGYKNYDDYSIAKERGMVRKTKETELETEWEAMSDAEKSEFVGGDKKWDEMGNKEKNAAQKKYVDKGLEDFDIHVKRLERYEFAREMRPFLGEDNKMHNGVAQWARDIARYYEEYGDDIYDWLQLNGALFGDNSPDDIPQPPNAD